MTRTRVWLLALSLSTLLAAAWLVSRGPIPTEAPIGAAEPASSTHTIADPLTIHDPAEHSVASPLAPLAEDRSIAPRAIRIVDATGAAVAGARARWIALDESWFTYHDAWPSMEWDAIERASIHCESDVDGMMSVPAGFELASTRPSLLWITHPDYLAVALSTGLPASPSSLPSEISLTPSRGVTVRVVDGAGTPLADATVVEYAMPAELDAILPPELLYDPRRVFRRTLTTDARGLVQLEPMPGKLRIEAMAGADRSEPWFGTGPAEVSIALVPTFDVGGHVTVESGARLGSNARVRCAIRRGADQVVLAHARVGADGNWGDIALPVLHGDAYAFFLDGGDFAQALVLVPPPGPRERLRVDLMARPGTMMPIRIATQSDESIAGATVSVHWNSTGEWQAVRGRTGADGRVLIPGCLLGKFWVRVRAKGFTPLVSHEMELHEPRTEPVVFKLDRGGTIHGRCTHDGQPVQDFTVLFWHETARNQNWLTVRDSVDGSFTIDEANLGEVTLMATSDEFLSTGTTVVSVGEGEPARADLAFPDPLTGRGQVVDAASLAPVATASVHAWICTDDARLRRWSTARAVDTNGRFELGGLAHGENILEVSAPGFATRFVSSRAKPDAGIDFGTIALLSKRRVLVQLTTPEPIDLARCTAELDGAVYVPGPPFTHDGMVAFDDLDPGNYFLRITFPDLSTYSEQLELGSANDVRVDVSLTTPKLTIEIVVEDGVEVPQPLYVHAEFLNPRGRMAERAYIVPETRIVAADGIDSGTATLTIRDYPGNPLANARATLLRDAPSRARIVIGGKSMKVLVVDALRAPLRDARLILTSENSNDGWSAHYVTDPRGECTLKDLSMSGVQAAVYHPSLGLRLSEPFQWNATREQIEMKLDPKHRLSVVARERATPAPGIQLVATDLQNIGWGLGSQTTDEAGVASWGPMSDGDLRISVQHPGYWTAEHFVRVPAPAAPVELQVRRLGNADFHVSDLYQRPIIGAAIELHSEELDASVADWIRAGRVSSPAAGLVTDAEGRLTLQGLPNGPYRWRVTTSSGESKSGTLTVPPSGVASVAIPF